MARRRALLAAAAATLLAFAGCGSQDHAKQPPALTAVQAQGLSKRLTNVRASAAAGDLPLTEQRLRGFVREVARLRAAGALDAPTATALTIGATRAAQQAPAEVTPPPPPALESKEGRKGKGHDKKKHGKGNEEAGD